MFGEEEMKERKKKKIEGLDFPHLDTNKGRNGNGGNGIGMRNSVTF